MVGPGGSCRTRATVAWDGGTSSLSQKGTVLIADDDDVLRESFKIWLADEWEVMEATTGIETLEKLDESVDALVLDRQMPELSGPEVMERLDDTSFEGKVFVISAYQPDEHLSETDVDEYLTKPISKETLNELLEQTDQ